MWREKRIKSNVGDELREEAITRYVCSEKTHLV